MWKLEFNNFIGISVWVNENCKSALSEKMHNFGLPAVIHLVSKAYDQKGPRGHAGYIRGG